MGWSDRVEFRGALVNLSLGLLPDDLLERIAAGEHPLAVLASATGKLRTDVLGLGAPTVMFGIGLTR